MMVNGDLRENGWSINTNFLAPGIESDHAYALTTLFADGVSAKHPFRFFNIWTSHLWFRQIVEEG